MICYICKGINNCYSICIPAISIATPSAVPTARPSPVEEHRKLFNYPAGIRSTSFQYPSNTQRASLNRNGKSKKIQTCTIKFFRLNKVYSTLPPMQIVEKAALPNSDLGPGTIVFDADGNSSHFHQRIIHKFPALEAGGEYELLLYQRQDLEKGFQLNLRIPLDRSKKWLHTPKSTTDPCKKICSSKLLQLMQAHMMRYSVINIFSCNFISR